MSDREFTLIIGNKNLSSWSLRPWLLMTYFNIPFEEKLVRLDVAETRKDLLQQSPSGLVPCLTHRGFNVWDSLAIAEYLAEVFPEKNLWPTDTFARARARSLAAEMHTGFGAIRATWPMEFCREEAKVWGGPGVRKEINRLETLWDDALSQYGSEAQGPFLFGSFSVADAMFAPIVSRLRTYGPVRTSARIVAWLEAVWSLPAMQKWGEGAAQEVRAGWYE